MRTSRARRVIGFFPLSPSILYALGVAVRLTAAAQASARPQVLHELRRPPADQAVVFGGETGVRAAAGMIARKPRA